MHALRQYQRDLIDKIHECFQTENKRVLLVLATGLGKTEVALEFMRKSRSALFLAHREELLLQPSSRLWIPHGIIKSGYPATQHLHQIGSIQTIHRRPLEYVPDLLIIDEAHRITAPQYQEVLDRFPKAKVLGLSATPYRMSGQKLPFDALVEGPSPIEAFAQGFLLDPRTYAPHVPDLSKAKIQNGDYGDCAHLVGNPVESYKQFCQGKPTLIFASSVAHSKQIAQAIGGFHVDGSLSREERAQVRTVLEKGSAVSNCDVLTEGFDYAPLECLILARPTLSMGLHFQQIGRVTRVAAGKTQALVFDHAGNSLRFGLFRDHYGFDLSGIPPFLRSTSQGGLRIVRCERCLAVYQPAPACPECGAVPSAILPSTNNTPLHLLTGEGKVRPPTPAEKAIEYARLLQMARYRVYKDGWADHQFRDRFGHWPQPAMKSRLKKLAPFHPH